MHVTSHENASVAKPLWVPFSSVLWARKSSITEPSVPLRIIHTLLFRNQERLVLSIHICHLAITGKKMPWNSIRLTSLKIHPLKILANSVLSRKMTELASPMLERHSVYGRCCRQVVVFIADDLGFLGPGSPDLMTELCPPQDTA